MKVKKFKGYSVADIAPIGLAVVIGVVAISIGMYVLTTMHTATANANASITDNHTQVINKGISAMRLFADWFSIIVIVAVSVIVIGLVYFLQKRGGSTA